MENGRQAKSPRRFYFPAAVAGVTVLYLFMIFRAPSWLIGTPEYHWPVLRHGLWERLPGAVFILAIAVVASLVWVLGLSKIPDKFSQRLKAYAILFLLGLAFQLGPAAVHRMGALELPLRVYLPDHTSYFTDAARIEHPGLWLESFPARIKELATHSRTHPPGAVLAFYTAQRLMENFPGLSEAYVKTVPRSREAMQRFGITAPEAAAGGLCALALLLVASGCVPLTFAVGRVVADDRTAGLAAILFASSPAFSHKTPILDHALAALILVSLWLVLTAVEKKRIERVALAGLVIGGGLMFGTALLAAIPLCALYAGASILAFRKQDADFKNVVLLLICFVILLAGVALLGLWGFSMFLGVNYVEIYHAITEIGWRMNNEVSGRIHAWMWIAWDPYEVLAFAGLPLAALFLQGVFRNFAGLVRGNFAGLDHWLLALVIFLVVLDLSGKVCYEASRLVWFCFPLIAIGGAKSVDFKPSSQPAVLVSIVIALQAISVLVFRMVF